MLLVILLVATFVGMTLTGCSTQESVSGPVTAGNVSNSGCQNNTRGTSIIGNPTLKFTKDGVNLQAEFHDYRLNCAYKDVKVECTAKDGVLDIRVEEVMDGDLYANCLCPVNIYYTIYNANEEEYSLRLNGEDLGIISFKGHDVTEIDLWNHEQAHEEGFEYSLVTTDTYQRLADFFDAELHHPYYMDGGQAFLGFFGELEWDAQPCYLINSMEEFQAVYKGTKQLPEVDFDKYSVLVGRNYGINGSESLGDSHFYLNDEGDHYRVSLSILHNTNPNYFYASAIIDLFYWDVYPKKESKPITLERRVVEKVIDYDNGDDMLKHKWTLSGYIDEDDNYHQVGEGWGDERFTVSFKDEGILNSRVGRNSFKATYQTHVKGAHLTSGDDLAYTGTISLSNASMTEVGESDPVAIYFAKHIGTIAYFDVNSFYLRLVTSNGVTFSFRESTLK